MGAPMSVKRTQFEKAAAAEQWGSAFSNLNALSMTEMLASLSALPKPTLAKLIERRFAYKNGVNMPRMEYAWTVVRDRKMPLVAPGDLSTTGQVSVAAKFLKKSLPSPGGITLKIIVFTDSIVTDRQLFPRLKKRTEEILESQGNAFRLDAIVHPTDIAYRERIYLSTQVEELIALAKKARSIPSDRIIVLMVCLKQGIDAHGMVVKVNGHRVIIIDSDTPNPDRATLLHEIGHCADLPHAGEAPTGKAIPIDVGGSTNVMALAQKEVARNTLTVTQGEFLAKAFFASK
jgi:hypothetical protein